MLTIKDFFMKCCVFYIKNTPQIYRGHPVVFNELQDKLFMVGVQHNNIFRFIYFSGDMFRSFRLPSGHLTGTFTTCTLSYVSIRWPDGGRKFSF